MGVFPVSALLKEFYNLEETNRFYFHYRVSSKTVNVDEFTQELVRRTSTLGKSRIGMVEIDEKLQSDTARIKINARHSAYIRKIGDQLWLVFYGTDVPEEIRRSFRRLFDSVKWLAPTWIRPENIEELYNKYSDEFGVVKVFTEFDPYYLLKRSRVPSEFESSMKKEWFLPRSIEVAVRAPKRDISSVFNEVMQKQITKAVRAKFGLEFSNPGRSDVIVNEDAEIIHEGGEVEATDSVLSDVESLTWSNLETYKKYLPTREYKRLADGSFDLVEFNAVHPIYFKLGSRTKYSVETSVKIMNLFTVSRKGLPIYGMQLERHGLDFLCKSFLDFDRSSFLILFSEDQEGSPLLELKPYYLSPMGLVIIHRLLREGVDWDTRILEEVGQPSGGTNLHDQS